MKSVLVALFITASLTASAQNVGINTNSPEATLHVAGSPTATNVADGVIPPKLTGNELKAKDNAYTAAKVGAMVYVTAAASPTTAMTANVTAAGFYYFDGSVWQRVVRSTTPAAGQLLNTVFIDDPGGNGMVSSTNNNTNWIDIFSISYTPVHNNSKIMVQYHNNNYSIGGTAGNTTLEEYRSQLTIGSGTPTINRHSASTDGNNNSITQFRTSTIFPIAGVVDNSVTTPITVRVQIQRYTGDDALTVNLTNGTLIIQEIAR